MKFSDFVNEGTISKDYGDTPEEIEDTLASCKLALTGNERVIKALEEALKNLNKMPDEWSSLPGYSAHCYSAVEDAIKIAKRYEKEWKRAVREMEAELR